jgi:hypothetical protein
MGARLQYGGGAAWSEEGVGGPAMCMADGGGRWSAQCPLSCHATRQGRGCGLLWADRHWLGSENNIFFQKLFNIFELIQSKGDVAMIQNFQIKYCFKYFEIRNNFPYWNFSKFRLEFELKTREGSRCLI